MNACPLNCGWRLILLLCLPLTFIGSAVADEGQTVATITTNTGKSYQNCQVFKTDPDGITFSHQGGGAKVLFAELSPALRDKFGYSAEAEAAYENARAEKKRERQERLIAYRQELAKAQAAAAAVELQRLALLRQQYAAPGYSIAYGGGIYGVPFVGGFGFDPFFSNAVAPFQGNLFHGGFFHGGKFLGFDKRTSPFLSPFVTRFGSPFLSTFNKGAVLRLRSHGFHHGFAPAPFVRGSGAPFAVPTISGFAPPLASSPAGVVGFHR